MNLMIRALRDSSPWQGPPSFHPLPEIMRHDVWISFLLIVIWRLTYFLNESNPRPPVSHVKLDTLRALLTSLCNESWSDGEWAWALRRNSEDSVFDSCMSKPPVTQQPFKSPTESTELLNQLVTGFQGQGFFSPCNNVNLVYYVQNYVVSACTGKRNVIFGLLSLEYLL